MAKAWIVDLWVKDATETLSDGSSIKIQPPAAQMRNIGKLEERFRTAKYGRGSRWRVAWYETENGVQRQRAKTFVAKREAEEHAASLEDDIRSGKYQAPEHALRKFSDVAEKWIASKKKPKPTTIRRYKRELTMYVNPQWGDVAIGSITREQIDDWVTGLQDGTATRIYTRDIKPTPLSPASIEHIVGVAFGGVLRYAVASQWLQNDPTRGVELPRAVDDGEHMVVLDHVEVFSLAASAYSVDQNDTDRVLINFLSYTGMRVNEALALRVSDIDLAKRRARVLRTWTDDIDGKRIVGPPKTWERRSVPLADFLVEEIRPLVKDQSADAWLFRAKRGGYIHDHNWRNRIWRKALLGAGLGGLGLTIHKLRHTAASAAIAAGADVKVVQKMLGHKDATETLNTYGHLWPDRLDEVADALEAARSTALGLDLELVG